eukprot:3175856-Prymnesium_polylepis.1
MCIRDSRRTVCMLVCARPMLMQCLPTAWRPGLRRRAGGRAAPDRVVRLVARPAGEVDPRLHAQELPQPDRAHDPVVARPLR